MQKKALILVSALGGLCSLSVGAEEAGPASPYSFNVGMVSDYLFRGVSQTHGDAALQGGVDYAHPGGFYLGAWGSTITWVKDYTGKGNTELDLYGGYKSTFGGGEDWNYDVGAISYIYSSHGPANAFGANPDTAEVYGAIGFKTFTVKYSRAISDHFIGWYSASGGSTRGSGYLEANYSLDLGDGWGVTAHAGHQRVRDLAAADYTDLKFGVTKDLGFGVVGLSYSDTNAKGKPGEAYFWPNARFVSGVGSTSGFSNVAKGKAVVSFIKTF